MDKFREQCLQACPEECNSIDEMMIPFRGKFSGIKQNILGKPTHGVSKYGRGAHQPGGAVFRLASTFPADKNFKIFADNSFTSIGLLIALKSRGIHYAGTVRPNRMGNSQFSSDKEFSKKGRGAMEQRVENHSNIVIVKWFDTKAVTLASTFAGVDPVAEARRWDKTRKERVHIPRPHAITLYIQRQDGWG